MNRLPMTAALVCTAALMSAAGAMASAPPGWPDYLAMGAVGGPNVSAPTLTSTGGDDDFGGKPIDVVFKYAGSAGNGDPGMIDPPTNALRMTDDLTTVSRLNAHPTRVAIVEYTAQMSGGFSTADFTNSPKVDPASGGTYLMSRHLISLSSDALAMNGQPVVYKGAKYYGSLILNPDLMGAIQQGNYIADVNKALPANAVDTAVSEAFVLHDDGSRLSQHLQSKRLVLGALSQQDLQRHACIDPGADAGRWLSGVEHRRVERSVLELPPSTIRSMERARRTARSARGSTSAWRTRPTTRLPTSGQHSRPVTRAGLRANNWLIRTMSPKGHTTFGWQDRYVGAVGSGYWLQADMTTADIAKTYATPVSSWLSAARAKLH